MAQKDYASYSGKKKVKKQSRSGILILIVVLILIVFATALYFMKENAPETNQRVATPAEKETPKAVLPTPPKEVWSYIKALETRIVPVDDNPESLDKNLQLTEEQKKVLMQMEKEQREAEIARSKQIQERQLQEEQRVAIEESGEQDRIEERRKAAAERKRQEEQQMALEHKQAEEKRRQEERKKVERQFGLQCGAFKNKDQAEKVQASLAISGFNARLTTNAEWNRVIIGPVGNRSQANEALSRAKTVTNCVLIAM